MKAIKLIGFMAFLVLMACEDKVTPTHFEYTTIFSGNESKTWKMKSIAFRNEGDPDWTLTVSCWADEQYTFYRDKEKKFVAKSGSNLCDPSEQDFEIIDTWTYNSASATLYFVHPLFSDSAIPFTVVEVSKSKMTLELFFNDGATQSYQLKYESTSEK